MNTLNKKIDQLKTPEAQQRLKDGALRELHKAQEKINELEKEKDQLTIIAETEKNQKLQEQKLKEGALAEVERLQDQKKLDSIEANIIQQRIGFFRCLSISDKKHFRYIYSSSLTYFLSNELHFEALTSIFRNA